MNYRDEFAEHIWAWRFASDIHRAGNLMLRKANMIGHMRSCVMVVYVATCSQAGEIKRDENAALWYWRAFAQLPLDKKSSQAVDEVRDFLKCPTGDIPRQLTDALPDFEYGFDELARAVSLTNCEFAVDRENGYALLLPHLAGMQSCAALVFAHARHAMENGDAAAVTTDLATGYRMAHHVGTDHVLISSVCAYRIFNGTEILLTECLNRNLLDQKQLGEIQQALNSIDTDNPLGFMSAIEAEETIGCNWAAKEFSGEGGSRRFLEFLTGQEVPPDREILSQEVVDRSLQRFRKDMKEVIAAFRDPNRENAVRRIERVMDSPSAPPKFDDTVVTGALMPAVGMVYEMMNATRDAVKARRESLPLNGSNGP